MCASCSRSCRAAELLRAAELPRCGGLLLPSTTPMPDDALLAMPIGAPHAHARREQDAHQDQTVSFKWGKCNVPSLISPSRSIVYSHVMASFYIEVACF